MIETLLPHLPAFAAAYAILFVAASSPGPAVALLLGIGTTQGRTAALTASAGIATGSVAINLATLAGVGLLLSQAAWAMQILRLIGAAYLAWLAWSAFRKAVAPPTVVAAQVARMTLPRLFATGLLLQITNPKAIVFWLAIAAIGATQGGGPAVVAAFVVGAFAISFLCHGAWAVLLSSSPVRRGYARARRWVEAGLGTLFAGFALRLATDRS
ncbi:LysE family translocator [Rhodobacteraceae bacterium CCMM004]|nr:LysE family translocator [Rhodobacteraceae bacterium CCMM004]